MLMQTAISLRSPCSTSPAIRSVCSTARRKRLEAFNEERRRQLQHHGNNIEKVIITVKQEDGEERHLLMNNRLSTFHECAKHISRLKSNNTGLAHVMAETGEYFASPHSAINGKADVQLLEFNNAEFAKNVNEAYWRSCAFLLGALAESSFRADVRLVEPLPPDVESGRFVYTLEIADLHGWKPSKGELDVLTRKALRDCVYMALPFEPLSVSRSFAADLFQNNPRKVESILKGTGEEVTVYKVGDHVDVSEGPLIANTRQMGRFAVTAVDEVDSLYHFCGVSIPFSSRCSSYSWDLLMNAARSQSQLRTPKCEPEAELRNREPKAELRSHA